MTKKQTLIQQLINGALVLAVIGLLGFLSVRFKSELDWTANKRNTLTDASVQQLGAMTDPITFYVFAPSGAESRRAVEEDLVPDAQQVERTPRRDVVGQPAHPAQRHVATGHLERQVDERRGQLAGDVGVDDLLTRLEQVEVLHEQLVPLRLIEVRGVEQPRRVRRVVHQSAKERLRALLHRLGLRYILIHDRDIAFRLEIGRRPRQHAGAGPVKDGAFDGEVLRCRGRTAGRGGRRNRRSRGGLGGWRLAAGREGQAADERGG
mgnify:CR=1 FL=1